MTRGSRRSRAVAAGIVLGVTLALAACSPPAPSAQSLTAEQAERLAVVRFRNFDAGVRAIDIRIPASQAGELTVTGWFDYAAGVGYGAAASESGSLGLVWWNTSTIATREVAVDTAVLPSPADGWIAGDLDPDSSQLAAVLTIVGSLGADRPENPQLLRQSDAAWLRSDEIGGVDVDVFAGPSGDGESADGALDARTHYWVDADGLLHRFEVRIGDATGRTLVDFAEAAGVVLPAEVPGS
jgi:hypothetical protein